MSSPASRGGAAGGGSEATAAASVEVERRDAVAIVTIANPSKRNALDPELLDRLAGRLDDLAARDARAVVLRGAGTALFSSGYDIGAIRGGAGEEASRHPLDKAMSAIERYPFPVLGMAFGGAYGAGVEVFGTCDLRYADDGARFAIPAAKLSVIYDAAGVARLASRTGRALVAELLFTARPMPAQRAYALGLLSGVLPAGELEAFVLRLAHEIAGLAPRTLTATKRMLATLGERTAFAAAEVAHFTELRNRALASEDFAEGQRAFAEKRPPRFTGR